jgi:phage baseplate assembly protein gpV
MEKNLIRIGRVSSMNKETGMVRVVYKDKNSTTSELPVFNFSGEYKMPRVGQLVLVLHLSNDSSTGIVMGSFWNKANKPKTSEYQKDFKEGKAYEKYEEKQYILHAENIVFQCEEGQISVKELIQMKEKIEHLSNNEEGE